MKYEVYNPAPSVEGWQKVRPALYEFLTKVCGYKGRKVKPLVKAEETETSEETDERLQ